jgi:hypothetical protein
MLQHSMVSRYCLLRVPVFAFIALAAGPLLLRAETVKPQTGFNTPQAAVDALVKAAASYDIPALEAMLGPGGEDLIISRDPVQDKNRTAAFAAKAGEKQTVTVDPHNSRRATVTVGNDDWPFPIPVVLRDGKWYFNPEEGREELLLRRIGANELDAITICRGFADAQERYAQAVQAKSGVHEYAQRIISTPGTHDGLYWENPDGTPGGPISKAIARAIQEGYSPKKGSPYHGYFYKVLKGQGPAARLGQMDFVVGGVMIGGYALLAVPAEYRVTGVTSFMVGYDGVVYQKDLGPNSVKLFQQMDRYNPDKTWQPTTDEW